MKAKIQEKFQTLFGEAGDLYASAGRINLIGEHTDYNGGYVFPGAIDCGIMAEIKVNGTQKVLSRAALELRPAPRGTSPANTVSKPSTLPPRLTVSRHTPKM